ncbi:hypothetical protein E5E91_07295 [Deinococcus radiodurans R1 = ATCC 13939 = DSM 20539]|uniref:Uncharacterized protein n=1 Tax=Deinococcus radiodurans (strain ATCC 13939 / DSM 20539 / JCM 16871 / CCUG 27074 / LMG 4051 / NBRC 15346 / NCIMB 9279 / VKM B-1422 / R1) TaxID=243230 RepID=Q9RUH4_DEIRA|nr:conserved hypothetical protein [Deinococcus radiodurans R1 = ATCC 13939 = DSM 20539]QEM72754.1 hypothetical protein DXG80_03210 [Deinococcus radiodurans]UDL00521.1 hypothetical protein E5E91_07295 [Deinococcus radiodurans R1 = ATCC 13939 = DSM 20539]HCE63975.1 hypothetical protein [Deinococcus radiodurans]
MVTGSMRAPCGGKESGHKQKESRGQGLSFCPHGAVGMS